MRRSNKIDDNQKEIVKDLRSIPGVVVALNHDDILVGYKGKTFWYEIKTKKGRVRPGQKKLEKEWTGHYKIVRSLEDILEDLGRVDLFC